jgi:DNA adenine methylase
VGAISQRLTNARITNFDFAPLIEDTSRHAVLFIDPPYFDKKLYRFDFNLDDHERLADLLGQTPHDWLLTYEHHPAVWELYEGWATIKPLYKSRRIDTLAISNRRGAI